MGGRIWKGFEGVNLDRDRIWKQLERDESKGTNTVYPYSIFDTTEAIYRYIIFFVYGFY
jgi:hypothetical protein